MTDQNAPTGPVSPAPVSPAAPSQDQAPTQTPQSAPQAPTPSVPPQDAPRQPEPVHVTVKRAFDKFDAENAARHAPGGENAQETEARPARQRDPATGRWVSAAPAETPPEAAPPVNAQNPPAEAVTPPEQPQSEPQSPPEPPAAPIPAPEYITSEAARAAWAETPEAVRQEVEGRVRHMAQGLQQQRQMLEPLQEHMRFAQEAGHTLPNLITAWRNHEQAFQSDPAAAVIKVAQSLRKDPAEIAEAILDRVENGAVQPAAPQAPQQSPEFLQIQQENQRLRGQVEQIQVQQRQQVAMSAIETFKATRPDYAQLEPVILDELRRSPLTGDMQADLTRAYDMARIRAGLGPAIAPAPTPAPSATPPIAPAPPAPAAAPTVPPHVELAAMSVHGSPANGINGTARPKSKSIRDSITWALTQTQ